MKINREWRRRGGFLCVLCCAVMIVSGCSDRRSEQLRAEGDTLRGLSRYDNAREAYEKAILANPDNPMAKFGLAQCSAAEGNVDEAMTLFNEALTLDPELEEAYVEGVRTLVNAERFDEALEFTAAYAQKSPEAGGTLHGVILAKAGRTEEAIQSLQALSEQFPDSEQIRLDLGAALLKGGKLVEAESIFSALKEGNTGIAVSARMGLVDVYRAQGRVDAMVEAFDALRELRPDDAAIKLGYARTLLLAKDLEKAEVLAREVLEQDPESGWANYVVGFCKAEAGQFEEAKAFLELAERSLPEDADVSRLVAYVASGGTAPKEAGTGDMPAQRVATAEASTWESLWKQAALNRLISSRETYLIDGGVEAREVLTLAALFSYQLELAKSLSAELPETSQIRGFMDAYLSKDAKKVAAHFEAWKLETPDVLRENALGFAMVSGGSREMGLSVFLYCLETWPDQGVALFNIAQVFRRLGQPVIAAQNLQRLIAMYPENIDAHQMHYNALREGRAFEASRRAAEASYTLFPDEKWSHLYLCQAYLDTGEPGRALEWLGRTTSQFPDDPELEAILARVLVRVGDCAEANNVLQGISTTAPAIMESRAMLMAMCKALEDDWQGVKTIGEAIAPAERSDALALLMAAALAQSGDKDAARAALDKGERPVAGRYGLLSTAALGGDGEGLSEEERQWTAKLGGDVNILSAYMTVIALQVGDLHNPAWNYYQTHLAAQPPHIALAQLAFRSLGEGDAIENAGESARAIATSLQEDPRAWLGLAAVLKSVGDTDGETEAIEMALEKGPKSPESLFRHASMMESADNMEAAVADYRTLVEVMPDNGVANNNLAYTLLLVGNKEEEALKYATVAAEKLPHDPGVLHTLGLAQMGTGDLEASRKNLERAAEIDPANPTIMYDFGRLLLKLEDKEGAQKRIRYAIAMSRNAGMVFPQAAEAEALLDTLP